MIAQEINKFDKVVMYTEKKEDQFKIEYTDLSGNVYHSPVTNYTREFARQCVRDIQLRKIMPMFDYGKRACLSSVRVIKS